MKAKSLQATGIHSKCFILRKCSDFCQLQKTHALPGFFAEHIFSPELLLDFVPLNYFQQIYEKPAIG
jgi:hypothetical protein